MITAEQLTRICPSIKGDRAKTIAALLDNICPKYGIDTADIFHEFIANVLEESAEFSHFEENLKYSAERLTKVWPTRFPSITAATPYAYDAKKLAEKVYGGRMGNVHLGDGYKFRGGGPIQITGRDMYMLFLLFINKKNGTNYSVDEIAEKLRTDLEIGIHSACWLFAIVKKLIPDAIADRFLDTIKKINGGLTNLQSRNRYYAKAKEVIT